MSLLVDIYASVYDILVLEGVINVGVGGYNYSLFLINLTIDFSIQKSYNFIRTSFDKICLTILI